MKKSRLLGAVCACFAAVSFNASASLVTLSNPTIIDSAAAVPGYEINYALDGNITTDYASAGYGVDTWIDFDFGESTLVVEVSYSDRTSSGSVNGSYTQGPNDNVTAFNLIFSDDLVFGDASDEIVYVDSPDYANTDIVSINSGDGFSTRYLRWDVVSISAAPNVGAAEFEFSTTSAVPIPAAVWLFGSGLLGLVGIARRKKA